TVRSLADQLERAQAAGRQAHYEAIVPVSYQDYYLVSHGQRRLWVLDQLDSQQLAHNISLAYGLEGSLSVASLRSSFSSLVGRHESLRTVFVVVEGEPRQKILSVEESGFELDYEDLRDDPQAVERAKQISEQMAGTAFDLSTGPLLRVKLLQIEETSYVFAMSMHHIVSDEWSMQVLFKEILLLYNAYVSGESNPLRPLSIHYKDYAHWQMGQLSGERLRSDQSYWMDQLSGELPLLELPTDYPRPSVKTYNGDNVSLALDPGLSGKLKMMGDQEGVTLFMVLLSTVYVLLYRYTGQKDLIVGTPVAGREHLDLEDQIGYYLNTLALRMQISGEESFKELLDKVKTVSLEGFAHQQYPFDKLVEELGVEEDPSHAPLFDVAMILQNVEVHTDDLPTMSGVEVSSLGVGLKISKGDLRFQFFDHGGGQLGVDLEYNTDIFKPARIERMAHHLEALLAALLESPALAIGQVQYGFEQGSHHEEGFVAALSAAEDWLAVSDVFEHCASAYGQAIAVREEHHQISYAELNNKSNRLGYLLRSLGVSQGDVVGVMVPAGIRSILGLLSILKTGGVYMPMSMSHSQRRLQQMFLESELRVLFIESGQLAAVEVLLKDLQIKVPYLLVFPNHLEDLQSVNSSEELGGDGVVMAQHLRVLGYSDEGYEELSYRMEDYSADNHDLDLLPDSASYVFYTSGSTGSGKAILGIHRSLSQYVHWHIGQWDVGPGSRISQLAPLTFDASLKDILVGLCSGGTVCVPGEGTRMHPSQLLDWLDTQRVTILQCVPSLFRLLTKCLSQTGAETADVLPYLRHVLLAGERLYGKDVARWQSLAGRDIELVNLYGLTETTILKTCYRLDSEHVWQPGELIPVGYPISGTLVGVINGDHICQVGELGEIYLKSGYMSKGYWHDAAMTANLFVQNPLVEDREDIVCRTGDLGRYREDGSLEVLGRKDDQVKLHGVRVELSEVSSALLGLPGVDQVELVVDQDEDYQQELICYYTGQERVSDWFRTELSIGLNAEYLPSYYVWLDEFPLNVNGKVDRKLLPKPIALEDTDYEPPRDDLELRLSEIWQVVLGDRRIGRKASFFTLGGSSLKAMQLVSHIYKEFEVLLKIGDLFSRPTLAGQAALIRAQRREVYEEIEPVAMQEDYALSHGQRRLWVLDQLDSQQLAHNIPLAYRLEGSLSVASLRSSFSSLVARHESLRTVFVDVEGEPRQKILSVEESGFELDYEDLRDDPQAVERAKQISEQMVGTAFDLSTGPLLRVKLLQIEETSYVFAMSMHHIVSDEWSMQVLFKEILLLYNAYVSGESNPLRPLSIHYKDYAHWQMGQLSGERLRSDQSYWMDQLS
ncbi:condensation domain-containing protein, partial [Fulvivirgaceae bacterium BMA12]|nr:condensation domain-containing protein [Fulvivirgaceae bacterium BMA12]